ncbi:hypothetical protein [Streptomyces sp. PH10-H1]|uniref:hypothetical protein n=1 Tax=Streptomyces sp. PH10-H1 TaxID=3046212 RepID=UPI0024BB66C6|nr:hypothetical protein [Streptomyces sp. PH10-H1]MDJ0346733.1 hypothetical protein [Streptomyces sp. PH10-H1]
MGVVAFLTLMFIIGTVVGPPKKTATEPAAEVSPTASSSPSTVAVPATQPPSPSLTHTAAPVKTTAAPASKAPPKVPAKASAADRQAAAAILTADDQHYRDELAKGQSLLGTPAYTAWYQALLTDTRYMPDFSKADKHFTADNEPTDLIEQWRSDNGDGASAVVQFAVDGLSSDAPNAATRRDATDALAGLAKADADAAKIAAG